MKGSKILNYILTGVLVVVIMTSTNIPDVLAENITGVFAEASEEEEIIDTEDESAEGVLLAPPRCADDNGETTDDPETEAEETQMNVEEYVATMYANTDSNIRKGPSTDYEVIGGAATNQQVNITGKCDNGWLRVDYNGTVGYIAGRLVSSQPVEITQPEEAPEQEPTPEPASQPESEPEPTPEPAPAPTRTPIATNPAPSGAEQEYINAILAAVITPQMSDREVAIALNNYICAIAEYDHSYSRYSAMSIFTSGSGVCQAYANAYWRLMNAAGIPTDYVGGQAFNGSTVGRHGWNRVLIDGAYYYVDVTWNDTCNNQYLLLSYEQMAYDHYEERINPYREY